MAAQPDHPRFTMSTQRFRTVTLAAVIALVLTIISGAAVRLTGSGLGCSTWPDCTSTSVVAPMTGHAWIEFGNRLINAFVTIAAIGALVAAWRRRPRRRDLTWLSFGLVVGLVLEVVMGGLVVYSKLSPSLVSAHFLLGLVFLGWAVVLHHRAGVPDGPTTAVPVVGRVAWWLGRIALAALAAVATAGTVVTSTGPHGGAPDTPRYGFALHSVARLHGSLAELFGVVTVVLLVVLARAGVPPAVLRKAQWMLAAVLLQGAIGYSQYFDHDPVGLVAIHVAGASVLVVATLRLYLGMRDHRPVGPVGPRRWDLQGEPAVGSAVRSAVGSGVGSAVGSAVGPAVGPAVGSAVGSGAGGPAVGPTVGSGAGVVRS